MEQRKQEAKKPQQKRFELVATTLQGMEDVLARELSRIGGNNIRVTKRAVRFSADQDLLYKSNLQLRTALRILKPIKKFKAADEDEFYEGVKAINWPLIFDVDKTIIVRAATSGPIFTNSHYVSLKCKDAVADRFREHCGDRPSVDNRDPEIVIHVKIWNEEVTISLDSSGTPLNKRGYRQPEAQAPLNECLAAGMLLLAGYEGKRNLVDGMSGSGTLAIEAALIANNIGPGLLRDSFSCMHWKDFNEDLFQIIHQATVNRIKQNHLKIIGLEKEFRTISLAREAALSAGVEDMLEFRLGDFFEEEGLPLPAMLVLNPPYGERIRPKNIEELYKKIGDKMKNDYSGYSVWILSANIEALHNVHLRTFDTHNLMNGNLPCKYSGYKMYAGTKTSN